jgi:hypothetical protein
MHNNKAFDHLDGFFCSLCRTKESEHRLGRPVAVFKRMHLPKVAAFNRSSNDICTNTLPYSTNNGLT